MAEYSPIRQHEERDEQIVQNRREGLSYKQIAIIHGVTRNVVSGALYRARDRGVIVDEFTPRKPSLGGPAWSR